MPKTWNVYLNRWSLHSGRVCRYLPAGKGQFYILTDRYEFELTYVWRKGICVTARWRRGGRHHGLSVPHFRQDFPSMAIKKRTAESKAGKHLAAVETALFADLMPLIEHCSFREYDDGSPRDPGWITIKTNGAAWVVQVKDPDSATSFSAVADTLDKALQTAGLLLACDEAPWENDSWLAASKLKKKK